MAGLTKSPATARNILKIWLLSSERTFCRFQATHFVIGQRIVFVDAALKVQYRKTEHLLLLAKRFGTLLLVYKITWN